jgi:hypothetical protein
MDHSYGNIHAQLIDLAPYKSTSSTTDNKAYKARLSLASTGNKS